MLIGMAISSISKNWTEAQNIKRANEDGFPWSINGTGNFVTIDNCFSCTNGQGSSQLVMVLILEHHKINYEQLNITNPNVRDKSSDTEY